MHPRTGNQRMPLLSARRTLPEQSKFSHSAAPSRLTSVGRVAVELLERQADVAVEGLVGAEHGRGHLEAVGGVGGDHVILVDAVAGDAEAADESAVGVDRRT